MAFVRVVYFPPNRACAHARPHIRPTNWLPSLSSHTYYYRRPEPVGTKVAIAKKVQTGCTAMKVEVGCRERERGTLDLFSISPEFQTCSDRK